MSADLRTVIVSHTSLRAEPRHAAEQISQLRLGDPFAVQRDGGEWCLGAGPDGYAGWARSWHLQGGPAPPPDRVVTARSSRACSAPGGETLAELSFATRLAAAGEPVAGWLPWTLPDGRPAWTPLGDLEPYPAAPEPAALIRWGLRLLGVAYEWGGGSSWGLDCSGLLQLVYSPAGLGLPRDSAMQAAWGALRDPEAIRPGDLLFYGTPRISHVGLALGDGELLHARAWVRVDRLDSAAGLGNLPLRTVRRAKSFP